MNAPVNHDVLSAVSNRHLDALEEETIFILREVAAAFERPALLFSGGKDSLVMLKCAEKAFGVGRLPFPLLMIDTGHNFPEVTDFRDLRAKELGAELIVRSVEDSMKRGTVRLARPDESRNAHQSVTLLEAIEEFRFDALGQGGRRFQQGARGRIVKTQQYGRRFYLGALAGGRLHLQGGVVVGQDGGRLEAAFFFEK